MPDRAIPAYSPAPAISIREGSEWSGVSEKTLRRYIAAGKLPAYRFGPRQIRIRLEDLDALFTRIPAAERQSA